MKTIHLIIIGRVQGVFYRSSAKHEADALGIVGWIRNDEDGSVECVAQGEEMALRQFEEWCQRGPRGAQVEHVRKSRIEHNEDLKVFEIR